MQSIFPRIATLFQFSYPLSFYDYIKHLSAGCFPWHSCKSPTGQSGKSAAVCPESLSETDETLLFGALSVWNYVLPLPCPFHQSHISNGAKNNKTSCDFCYSVNFFRISGIKFIEENPYFCRRNPSERYNSILKLNNWILNTQKKIILHHILCTSTSTIFPLMLLWYPGRMVPKRLFSIQYSVFFAIVTLSMVINCK